MFNAIITGNLGKDPEQRTVGESTVTVFSVAARTAKKDKETGNSISEWVDVVIWGKRGDYWHQNLHKGNKVVVTGTLSHRAYLTKDGQPACSIELNCAEIESMTPRDPQSGTAAPNTGGFTEVDSDELPF